MSWHKGRLSSGRWEGVRKQVFRRDGYRCRSCGKASRLECDHVTALHLGGDPWALDNLQSLCKSCHRVKTAGELSRGTFNKEEFMVLQASRRSWEAFVAERRREIASHV